MMQDSHFPIPEQTLKAFRKVVLDPAGQAVVIVGPAASGKSVLLQRLLEEAREHHSYEVDRIFVRGPVVVRAAQSHSAMLQTIAGSQSRGHPIRSVQEYLRLLRDWPRQRHEKERLVIGIDVDKTLPAGSESVWLQIVQGLPERVKLVIAQRSDDVLASSETFMSLPNVVRIPHERLPLPGKADGPAAPGQPTEAVTAAGLRNRFCRFLVSEKGWSEAAFVWQNATIREEGMFLRDPAGDRLLAVVSFRAPRKSSIIAKASKTIHAYIRSTETATLRGYVVCPATVRSRDPFGIFGVSEIGEPEEMTPRDFPTLDELVKTRQRETTDQRQQEKRASEEDSFEKYRSLLSPASTAVVDSAVEMARQEKGGFASLTTSCLLFSLMDFGSHSTSHYTAHFLWLRIMVKSSPGKVAQIRDAYFRRKRQISSESQNQHEARRGNSLFITNYLVQTLALASHFALRTTGQSTIHVRHLLAGLLLYRPEEGQSGCRTRIEEMGTTVEWVLAPFPDHLHQFTNDNLGEWQEILSDTRAETVVEVPELPPQLALMTNDQLRDAEGKLQDRLNVQNEVNAISTLIAACKAEPPISIGLFGDWGSGKSFFMDMMYDRINLIQRRAREWADEDKESAFCTNIIQIKFNAWHYMDQNLWASLVTHVFDELARAISDKDREGDLEEKKKLLFAKVESTKQQLKEAEGKRSKATELKQIAADACQKASENRRAADQQLNELRTQDVLALVLQDPQVRLRWQEIASKLGVPQDKATRAQLQEVVDQSRMILGKMRLVLKGVWAPQGGSRRRFWLTLSLLVLPALIVTLIGPKFELGALGSRIAALVTFCVTCATAVLPWLQQVSKGLNLWEDAEKRLLVLQAEKSTAKTQEVTKAQDRLRQLEDAERRAGQDVLEAEKRVQEAVREYEEILTGRRLYRFIEERSRRVKYKEQLGIISLIREDFQQLSELVARSAEEEEESERDAITRIDRIVLYIDDLDRCPSKRVVEVLQAVHLLLAFKLFVVVVGVDPRWILHALREEYSAFGANRSTTTLDHRWLTTPQNYVEKIFQIPFALRPMADDGYRRLVRGLVTAEPNDLSVPSRAAVGKADRNDKAADEQPTTQHTHASTGRAEAKAESTPALSKPEQGHPDPVQTEDVPSGSEKPKSRIVVDEQHAEDPEKEELERIDMQPKCLEIRQEEIEFMARLGDVVQSPRATKRLINVYRLIRATICSEEDLSRFEPRGEGAGDYRIVLLMLAILTRFPDQATSMLKTLAANPADVCGFSEFVAKLKAKKIPKSDPPTYRNIVRTEMSEMERITWDKLSVLLAAKRRELGINDSLEAFVHWASCVARFSFQYDQSAF
jgi:hypothetical protein